MDRWRCLAASSDDLYHALAHAALTVREVTRWLRSYGAQGILERVAAILIGRPGGHQLAIADHQAYDDAVLGVVRHELGLTTPIIAGMDFGHTDPFFVRPYGVRSEIDCDAQSFSIVEGAVVWRTIGRGYFVL
jgi:muramoyltetrapeptide carboxypeptidase LdcA involved in peptidoglycan recycling